MCVVILRPSAMKYVFDMCVVILRPSAMKYVVFSDSYVSRLGRLDLSLCLPGEVRFFGRGGMRVLHVPNDEWRQMMIFSPDHVILHLVGWLVVLGLTALSDSISVYIGPSPKEREKEERKNR